MNSKPTRRLSRAAAKAAVAAHTGLDPEDYRASSAGAGTGAWYLVERDLGRMIVDDQVWVVLADGTVTRAVPPGHPWLPADDLAAREAENGQP
jgi:hypothetical protein